MTDISKPKIKERIKQALTHVEKKKETPAQEVPQPTQTTAPPASTQKVEPDTVTLPRLISVLETSTATGLSRTTIHRLMKSGELPFVRMGGPSASIRFKAQDVRDFIDNHTHTEWDNPPPRGKHAPKKKGKGKKK